MLTPSMGFCGTPLTVLGCGSPAASSTVGATSITWWYWLRISPFALIPFGQQTTAPLVVPPYCVWNCEYANGVLSAIDQPAGGVIAECGPPTSSRCSSWYCRVSGDLVERAQGVVARRSARRWGSRRCRR